jgi:hypothetical protein
MSGSLCDVRTGLSFTIAAGSRQRSHVQVRVRGTREQISLSQIRDFLFRRLLWPAGLRRRYSTRPQHETNPHSYKQTLIRTSWKTPSFLVEYCSYQATSRNTVHREHSFSYVFAETCIPRRCLTVDVRVRIILEYTFKYTSPTIRTARNHPRKKYKVTDRYAL